MIMYLTGFSKEQLDFMNIELYKLIIADEARGSDSLFGVFSKDNLGVEWASEIETETIIHKHPRYDITAIANFFISEGIGDEAEMASIGAYIAGNEELNLMNIMPRLLQGSLKTYEQMQADGWFPAQEV